jgi:4-aminobutyrate aminotransferase-like enzyme
MGRAVATIQTIREEKLLENTVARGAQLLAGLKNLQGS